MPVRDLVGRRVVIVDDDANQAAPLAQLLRLEGLAASYEQQAMTALSNLSIDPPDAIIVDIRMPELSGPDLVATLRVKNRQLPAVFLTSCLEDDPQVQSAIAAGRAAYLSKPVELEHLLDVLARLLAS